MQRRAQGWTDFDVVAEVGSGPKLRRVVEHLNLSRFGFEMVAAVLASAGRRAGEVGISACRRLYGRRSARNRAQRALEAMGCR